MLIALYSRTTSGVEVSDVQKLLDELAHYHISAVIYEPFYAQVRPKLTLKDELRTFSSAMDLHTGTDFFVSMGGDGTLLDSVTFVRNKGIPVIGINFGRLGFLAGIGREDIRMLAEALINRTFQIDKRTMVHVDSNIPLFGEVPYALNEFTIHKKDTSAMIKIHTYLNGEFLNTYWADGLIVSTPTGSTGYSLSCGGPVVFPDSRSFVITPVAPHNLNVRPIIVPDHNIISFEIEGRSEQFLCTIDSRMKAVGRDVQLAIRKEDFSFGLLRLHESNFLTTIRNKLMWGFDKRN